MINDEDINEGYHSKLPRERNTIPKNDYFYILESESSQGSDDGSESILSVQGKETDLAKDTSDTDWSIDGSDVEYELVSSSEERADDLQSQIIGGDITSDSDNQIISTTVISFTMLDDGDIVSADSEESVNGTSSENEKHLLNYSLCAQCRNSNNNPRFRYCEKCFKLRKDLFPPRPKPKRTKSIKNKKHGRISKLKNNHDGNSLMNGTNSNSVISLTPKLNFQDIFVPPLIKGESSGNISAGSSTTNTKNPAAYGSETYDYNVSDSGVESVKESEKNVTSRKRKATFSEELNAKRMNTDECIEPVMDSEGFNSQPIDSIEITDTLSTSFSQPLFSSVDVTPLLKSFSNPLLSEDIVLNPHNFSDNNNRISIESKTIVPKKLHNNKIGTESPDMCITCLVEPKSGVFVHGRIAHICCCYRCSVKIWTKTKRCPICKCKVNNVLRAFVV